MTPWVSGSAYLSVDEQKRSQDGASIDKDNIMTRWHADGQAPMIRLIYVSPVARPFVCFFFRREKHRMVVWSKRYSSFHKAVLKSFETNPAHRVCSGSAFWWSMGQLCGSAHYVSLLRRVRNVEWWCGATEISPSTRRSSIF